MRSAIRIFGALNVLAALFSLLYFAWGIEIHWGKWPGAPDPADWAIFLVIGSVCTSTVLYLAVLGVRLIRGDHGALRRVIPTFLAEIIIFLGAVAAPAFTSGRNKLIWFWLVATFPVQPQVLFGYAFVGTLAAVVLIFWDRNASVPPTVQSR
jgi:hypothetical protein